MPLIPLHPSLSVNLHECRQGSGNSHLECAVGQERERELVGQSVILRGGGERAKRETSGVHMSQQGILDPEGDMDGKRCQPNVNPSFPAAIGGEPRPLPSRASVVPSR